MDLSLLDYIKNSLSQGIPKQNIEQALLQTGWKKEDIDKAFSQIQQTPSTTPPENQSQTSEPTNPSKNKWPVIGMIVIILIVLAGSGSYYFLNFIQRNTNENQETNKSFPSSNQLAQESIFNAGLYLNRDLQFSFKYPTNWILEEKVIDKKGNLNNLTFLLDPAVSELSKLESFTVSVTKEKGENYIDFVVSSKSNLSPDKRQLGDLNGDFYSTDTDKRSDAIFIATLNNIKYGFHLSVPVEKEKEYLAKFEELVSSVKVNDTRASNLPEYFRDNLALDKRLSQPSHIPNNFSITYEKQQQTHQEWNYSIGVWERGSGPNNLNIYVQRVDTKNDLGPRQFTVNLENLLEEKSIYQPVVEKGVAKVEPVEVKGFRGYFINIGNSPDNSYGSLIFATDVVAVSIDYISEPDSVFSKEELLKIAESMLHT